MSYAAKEGKDTVMFVDKEYVDAQKEEKVQSQEEEKESTDQSAAYDPETGEINWDCPCLGGMATGPCGDEFKAAFSCFVYSTEEPKGIDCVERFRDMQNCFRQHPDVYGDEIDEEDDDEDDTKDTPTTTATPTEPTDNENKDESKETVAEPEKHTAASCPIEEGDTSSGLSAWLSSFF